MLQIKMWGFIFCFNCMLFFASLCGANDSDFSVPFIIFFLGAKIKIVAFLDTGILRKKYIFPPES